MSLSARENQIARMNAAKAQKLLNPTIKTTHPTVFQVVKK